LDRQLRRCPCAYSQQLLIGTSDHAFGAVATSLEEPAPLIYKGAAGVVFKKKVEAQGGVGRPDKDGLQEETNASCRSSHAL
jgi:hypothetical protein